MEIMTLCARDLCVEHDRIVTDTEDQESVVAYSHFHKKVKNKDQMSQPANQRHP